MSLSSNGARTAFRTLQARLQALGANFGDVVMMNTLHDWSAPEFKGDRVARFEAVLAVKREFLSAPHPAWTAVGTSALLREGGVVEVQMIAYAPAGRCVVSARVLALGPRRAWREPGDGRRVNCGENTTLASTRAP